MTDERIASVEEHLARLYCDIDCLRDLIDLVAAATSAAAARTAPHPWIRCD